MATLIPNLDALPRSELQRFSHKAKYATKHQAWEVLGHIRAPVRTLRALGRYADLKASAMAYREQGKIQVAMNLEKDCEALYRTLPPEVRW